MIRFNLSSVLTTVKFYHQSAFHAAKINNERADRALPAKLGVTELPCAQTRPEPAFDFCLITAQSAGAVTNLDCLSLHEVSPSP
jgi:hypothetical protein